MRLIKEITGVTVALAVFAGYRVRIACTKNNAKKFRLACELDRRLAKM